MSARRAIALNTSIQFLGKAITAGATFITTILLARNFGAAGYGEYTKIAAFVAIFLLIIDFGGNAVALPLMKDRGEAVVFSHLFFLRLFFGVILATLAPLIALLLPYNELTQEGFARETKLGILLLSSTIIFQGIFLSGNAVFQKKLRYDRSVIAGGLGSLTTIIFLVILLFFRANLVVTLTAFVAGSLALAAATIWLLRAVIGDLQLSFSLGLFRQLIKASLPIGLTLIFNLLYLRTSTFILATTRPTLEVGVFGLAYKFFEFLLTIPTFFMNAVYPVLVDRRHDRQVLALTYRKAFWFLLTLSVIIMILGYSLAPLFTLVKEDFSASIVPFRILILGLPLFFLSSLLMWFLIVFEKRLSLLTIYGSTMIIATILNLWLVPLFGPVAAAGVTIVGEAIIVFLTILAFRRINQARVTQEISVAPGEEMIKP